MRTAINRFGLASNVLLTLLLGATASADERSCANLMRHQIVQSFKQSSRDVTPVGVYNQFCGSSSETVSGNEALAALNLSLTQRKATKDLICGSTKPVKKNKAKQRVLKSVIGNSVLRNYEQCLSLSKQGVELDINGTGQDGVVDITVELNDRDNPLLAVEIEPQGAAHCDGSLNISDLTQNPLQNALWGRCSYVGGGVDLRQVSINLRFRKAAATIHLSPPAEPSANGAVGGNAEFARAPMPSIQGCEVSSHAERIMTCRGHLAQVLCYRELEAGNVLDCRIDISGRLYPNRPEVQYIFQEGEFDYVNAGILWANVYQGRPEAGEIDGELDYSINFDTPVRARRGGNVCDASCPLFGNEEPCNRNCAAADHILETEAAGGALELTREAGDSCEAPLDGKVTLGDIDRFRAYNLCEARNAWGGTTTGIMYAQVSKYYYFNDYRTRHVVSRVTRNGVAYNYESWELNNAGERVRAIGQLEIPFTIWCRR